MSYTGRGGHYWDKSSCIVASKGEYYLGTGDTLEFGEPIRLVGTGTVNRTYRQRLVESYKGVAGATRCIGVGFENRIDVSTWSNYDRALHKGREFERDITVILRGPVQIRNVGTGEIEVQNTVIPADGGCEIMTVDTQFSLGTSMQKIVATKRGLIFVHPDYEKPIF